MTPLDLSAPKRIDIMITQMPPQEVPLFKQMFFRALYFYLSQYTPIREKNKITATRALYALMDEDIAAIPQEIKLRISCKKGCSFCCHQDVTIGADEAESIADYCKEHRIGINKKYLKKQLRIPEHEVPFSKVSACVFLHSNTCSIYPVRPFNCRKYLVYNDPDFCNIPKYPNHRTEEYFDFNLDAITAVGWYASAGRMPAMLLPYSK